MADSEVYLSKALIMVHAYFAPDLEKSVIIIRSPSEKCRCKAKTPTIRTEPILIYFDKNKEISAITLYLPALSIIYVYFALLFRTLPVYYSVPCESKHMIIVISGPSIIISMISASFADEMFKYPRSPPAFSV